MQQKRCEVFVRDFCLGLHYLVPSPLDRNYGSLTLGPSLLARHSTPLTLGLLLLTFHYGPLTLGDSYSLTLDSSLFSPSLVLPILITAANVALRQQLSVTSYNRARM